MTVFGECSRGDRFILAILVAATPLNPTEDGKCWAFHFINDSTDLIESVVLQAVEYEWGDAGGGSSPQSRFGPIAPGACLEIWRDDDSAAEVRMDLKLLVRIAASEHSMTVEFGMLYRTKHLSPIPVLGRDGVVGRATKT